MNVYAERPGVKGNLPYSLPHRTDTAESYGDYPWAPGPEACR